MSEEKVVYGGWRIREARLRAAIGTQKELSRRTGISPTIISDLERGRRPISPAWALRIAEAVGTKSENLLADQSPVQPPAPGKRGVRKKGAQSR